MDSQSSMKHILLGILLFTTIDASTTRFMDYREGKQVNTCLQTAELFEDKWYPLTIEQKSKSVKLDLTYYSDKTIILGGVNLKYVGVYKELSMYYGITPKNQSILITVSPYTKSILDIKIGELHVKEYTCKKKY